MSVSHVRGTSRKLYARFYEDLKRSFLVNPNGTYAIVPTPLMARGLVSRLGAEGVSPPKGAISTPSDMAMQLFKELSPSITILSNVESDAILKSILLGDPERFSIFYREDGSLRHAFVPAVRSFIEMLMDFGIEYPRALGRLVSGKSAALGLVISRYLVFLRDNNCMDSHQIPEWVAEAVGQGKYSEISSLFIYGIYEPHPSTKRLLDALQGLSPTVHIYDFSNDNRSVSSDANNMQESDLTEELALDAGEGALSQLFLGNPLEEDVGERLSLTTYQTNLEELRGVASKIEELILSGVQPSDIAILLPLRAKSAPLLRQVLDEFSIPAYFTFPRGITESPIVQIIFRTFDLIDHNYRLKDVVQILRSPSVRFHYPSGASTCLLNSYEIGRYGRESRLEDGGDWGTALRTLAERKRSESSSILDDAGMEQQSRKIQRIEAAAEGMEALIEMLSSLGGEQTVEQHVHALREVIEKLEIGKHYCHADDELRAQEAAALKVFMGLLDDVERSARVMGGGLQSLEQFSAQLMNYASTAGWGPLGQRQGSVLVGGLRSAALEPFKHIFIVGMIDGDIPSLDPSNPLATEEETIQIGLLSPYDVLRHERYYFFAALISAEIRVHLSYSISNDGDPVIPSPFIEDVKAAFGKIASEEEGSSRSRMRVQELIGMGMVGKVGQESFPALSFDADLDGILKRIQIEEVHRNGRYSSPYDGVMSDDTDIVVRLKDTHFKRKYSPSQLEAYADCPFRYYMRYVLKLAPEPKASQEVQPSEKGQTFHRIAYRFYAERNKAGKEKISPLEAEVALERIREIGVEELTLNGSMSASREAFARRLLGEKGFPGLLGMFIESELKDPLPGLQPRFFEKAIGVDGDVTELANPSEDAVVIELGRGTPSQMLLRCIIDRVDIGPDNTAFVVDYKTGSNIPSASSVKSGDKMQLPLYIMALEQVIQGVKCIGAGYYAIREGDEFGLTPILGDSAYRGLMGDLGRKRCVNAEFRQTLESSKKKCQEIIGGMMRGVFHPSTTGKECSPSCDYFSCCRFNELRVMKMGRT